MKKKDYSTINTSQIVEELKEVIRLMDMIDAKYGMWFVHDRDYRKYKPGTLEYYKLKIRRCKKVTKWLSRLRMYLDIALRSTESSANSVQAHIDRKKENHIKREMENDL